MTMQKTSTAGRTDTGRHNQTGVSLIEALVAMTVVGIGMVSLVGVQGTLRANADVSKQRSEAVRLGQSAIEDARAFTTLAEYVAFQTNLTPPAQTLGNASFTVQRVVAPAAAPLVGKSVAVTVQWTDRTNTAQAVRLNTWLAGISPELGASLALAPTGGATRGPGSRSLVIPRRAVDLLDGTSALRPAGESDTVWRFQNLTGEVQFCTLVDSTPAPLVAGNLTGCTGRALLYSGFVRFALTPVQPTEFDALTPGGPVDGAITWALERSGLTNENGRCFDEPAADNSRAFYCAVPLIAPSLSWSGTFDFGPTPSMAPLATNSSNTLRKVCRYLPQTIHPLVNIRQARINQNYLVIRAGNGAGTPFDCPSGTEAHQPD